MSAGTSDTATHHAAPAPTGRRLGLLVMGALGVVYGDIGTSPLYAVKACFTSEFHPLPVERATILGVLSLIFWSLMLIVSIKYVAFVLRADNRGEGGELALTALALRRIGAGQARAKGFVIILGICGAALLYGDGMITPAISVLSAVEGLSDVSHWFDNKVLIITVAILIGLFSIQSKGTGKLGRYFGPIVLAWFVVLGVLGASWIARAPGILHAVNPYHALHFLSTHGLTAFLTMSSVFLCVTGGEALYADLGHFGRRPIRFGWYGIALPALLLNYFGQGALLMVRPEAAERLFFRMVPETLVLPLVLLATVTTVIASQAVISGAFSMTKQAVQLGYLPRLEIRQMSGDQRGQIYVPFVNWVLAFFTIWLVLEFRSAAALEGAYGIAVSMTMVLTTVLLFFVARRSWGWSPQLSFGLLGLFLSVELLFLGANITKIAHGGWFPLTIGALTLVLMTTWRKGRELIARRLDDRALPLDAFVAEVAAKPPTRVKGVSVFMTSSPEITPVALLHNVKNNRIVHENVVILGIRTEDVPQVAAADRVQIERLPAGFTRILARTGFMESPDVPAILDQCRAMGLDLPVGKTTYFLGRTTLIPTARPGLAGWRKRLFALMARNAERATSYFNLPPGRVVELGQQVEM